MAEGETTSGFNPGDPHFIKDADIVLVTGLRRMTYTLQGAWDNLLPIFKNLKQGCKPEKLDKPLSDISDLDDKVVAAARVARGSAGLAEMTVTFLDPIDVKYWSLDFVPVTKDIHSWKADDKDEDKRPDLSQIVRWEQCGANGDLESYNSYLPGPGEPAMEGNTLTLAKKIRKGVQSYTIHTPVITITIVKSDIYDYLATGPIIDNVYSGSSVGETIVGSDAGSFPVLQATSLKDKWMLTSHRISGNPDGTFNCVQQWTGVDDVDPDLYDSQVVNDETSGV